MNEVIVLPSGNVFFGTVDTDGDMETGCVYRFNESLKEWQYYRVRENMDWCHAKHIPDEVLDAMAELPKGFELSPELEKEVFEAASESWDVDRFDKRKKELALSLSVDDGDMVAKAYVELSDEHFVHYYDDNKGLSDAGIHTTGLYASAQRRRMTDIWLNDMRGQKTTLETHINGGGRDTHAICVWLNDCVVVIEDIWFEVKHVN